MSVACGTRSWRLQVLAAKLGREPAHPVTFAPGRLMLATSPTFTGSAPLVTGSGSWTLAASRPMRIVATYRREDATLRAISSVASGSS